MEENQERKVLISIKVSTLLLILISIIATVVIFNVIKTKINENKNLNIAKEKEVEQVNVQENNKDDKTVTQTIEVKSPGVIKAVDRRNTSVTDRSINARELVMNPEVEEINVVEEDLEDVVEEKVMTTTPIEEVKISIDMDLTVRTGLSREDFIKLMTDCKADTSGFFEENAGLIYDVCEKYGLNEIFFCGLISAESGWNIAPNHRRTHNYISLMSGSGLIRFNSVEEGIEKAAQVLHDRYLTPGGSFYFGKTLAAVKTRFCPASPTWTNLVYQRMAQIVK